MNEIMHPIEVKALDDFKIWLKYPDGVKGELDLSDLNGKGVFVFWNDYSNFQKVYLDKESGAIAWNEEIDICPDSAYMDLVKQKEIVEVCH